MKFAGLVLAFSLLVISALTQDLRVVDSLTHALSGSKDDTTKVNILLQISNGYISSSPGQAIRYGDQARDLAQKLNFKSGKAFALKNIGMVYYNQTKYLETIEYWNQSYLLFDSLGDMANKALLLNNIGSVYMNQGDFAKALDYYFRSLQIAEQSGDRHKISIALGNIGTLYANNKFTYGKALEYFLKALALNEQLGDKNVMGGLLVNIGETYLNRDEDDSALYYFERSLEAYKNTENIPYSLNDIGITYTKKGKYSLAKQYHEKAISFAIKYDLKLDIAQSYDYLGDTYYKMGDYSAAAIAYKKTKAIASDVNLKKELKNACLGLTMTYAALKDFSNAFKCQTEYISIKDTLFNIDIAQKVSNLQSGFEIQKKQNQIDILTKNKALQELQLERQTFARNTLIAGLVAFFIIAFVLFSLYRQLGHRTTLLTKSLEELKSTQAQLIQSEKMASLGELTAGIAHEIQNPLNFVNNFSEVNTELLEELEQGILDGNIDELKSIANNIKENEQKINHHGKRADAIVKGMLLHSRTSNGKKETSDINALADEYFRFAYYGFRTKDKTFNPAMETDFDKTIGNIFIVQQDIGRVLLNLYNNAFYAVYEKMKKHAGAYTAKVSVRTKKTGNKIDIIVTDNGIGIPQKLMDKIFQPFFTTKPAGEGTGLGLSLSYDIVKAHGGEITATSVEEGQTIFKVILPFNSS